MNSVCFGCLSQLTNNDKLCLWIDGFSLQSVFDSCMNEYEVISGLDKYKFTLSTVSLFDSIAQRSLKGVRGLLGQVHLRIYVLFPLFLSSSSLQCERISPKLVNRLEDELHFTAALPISILFIFNAFDSK